MTVLASLIFELAPETVSVVTPEAIIVPLISQLVRVRVVQVDP